MTLSAFLRRRLVGPLLKRLPAEQRALAVERLLDRPVVVDSPHGPIRFLGLGRSSMKRARTLMTKEPGSLAWIDRMEPGSSFWDIGANVGVLTLYAAARRDLRVWAFEPAAVNFYALSANCELNDASPEVRCLQLGFADVNDLLDLHVSQLQPARSFTLREKPSRGPNDKQRRRYPARQAVQVWRIDDFIAGYGLECPNYLKIDVPGVTPEILAGAQRTLARPEVREIQVEVKENGPGGRRVAALLEPHGFRIAHRHRKADGATQGDLVFAREPRRTLVQVRPSAAA